VSCYAAWHPSGNFFAVPLRTNGGWIFARIAVRRAEHLDIGIISREGWSKQATFSQDGHKSVSLHHSR
jgi:chromosome transmission fidelity protein 4